MISFLLLNKVNVEFLKALYLGSLLLIVFINDFPLVVTECKMNLYVDDSLMYTSSKCVTTTEECQKGK